MEVSVPNNCSVILGTVNSKNVMMSVAEENSSLHSISFHKENMDLPAIHDISTGPQGYKESSLLQDWQV